MRLGLVIQNNGSPAVEAVRRLPPLAEEFGYDSLWVTDHVVGVRSFQPVYGRTWMEPLTSLSHIAAATSRIRLGIGVLVVPYRDPVYTAKVIATLDQLSEGRVDVGVGTGWSRSEFHALGRGDLFEQRGAVTDEYLDVMLRCWEGGEFGFEGRFVQFRRIQFDPVPVQQPHPPLWIGGRSISGSPMRRAAKYADAWHPTGISAADFREGAARLDDMQGRKIRKTLRTSAMPGTSVDELLKQLAPYRDAGCDEVAIDFGGLDSDLDDPGALDRIIAIAEGLAARRAEL